MPTTTDFDFWLSSNVDNDDYKDIYSLYQAVESEESEWNWKITRNKGGLFVKGAGNLILCIASEKAKYYFLKTIEKKYCDNGEMDMELWYAYKEDMHSDNS